MKIVDIPKSKTEQEELDEAIDSLCDMHIRMYKRYSTVMPLDHSIQLVLAQVKPENESY